MVFTYLKFHEGCFVHVRNSEEEQKAVPYWTASISAERCNSMQPGLCYLDRRSMLVVWLQDAVFSCCMSNISFFSLVVVAEWLHMI